MIKSMTGFASVSRETDVATVAVTVRSVNHRYLDLQMRLSPGWIQLEPRLRALAQARVARGRVELAVSVQVRQAAAVQVDLNEPVLRALADAFTRARAQGLVGGELAPGDVLRVPQAVTIREVAEPPAAGPDDEVGALAEEAVAQAFGELDAMRRREGGHLQADLDARRAGLGALLDRLAAAADRGRAALEARLQERVREMTPELQADPAAIAQEIVRYAARSDISEEVVRFRAHLAQWAGLTAADEPCGRKLDFVLQEMNREANTIGAKADGSDVSVLIVELKAELEKMREQVQNVE